VRLQISPKGEVIMKSITVAGAVFLLALLGTNATGQTVAPERVRNIEKAGAEIGAIQKKSGANGAFACYTRERRP
jgi:hypothetical protein